MSLIATDTLRQAARRLLNPFPLSSVKFALMSNEDLDHWLEVHRLTDSLEG